MFNAQLPMSYDTQIASEPVESMVTLTESPNTAQSSSNNFNVSVRCELVLSAVVNILCHQGVLKGHRLMTDSHSRLSIVTMVSSRVTDSTESN